VFLLYFVCVYGCVCACVCVCVFVTFYCLSLSLSLSLCVCATICSVNRRLSIQTIWTFTVIKSILLLMLSRFAVQQETRFGADISGVPGRPGWSYQSLDHCHTLWICSVFTIIITFTMQAIKSTITRWHGSARVF